MQVAGGLFGFGSAAMALMLPGIAYFASAHDVQSTSAWNEVAYLGLAYASALLFAGLSYFILRLTFASRPN